MAGYGVHTVVLINALLETIDHHRQGDVAYGINTAKEADGNINKYAGHQVLVASQETLIRNKADQSALISALIETALDS